MYDKKLMREIQQLGFAALDLNLYLDTHPDCKKAISDYNVIQRQYENKRRMYELNVGPLVNFGMSPSKYPWEWLDGPWPWENE
ncbi:spore coat protein CotJB [Vallitalea sediminicola]|jgi:spore coat protein JB|uniref:Spore coat protein CotJB n=2 Tax=Vallitalea TaxID=1348611 RepID=A0A8J8M7I3_9FIRM|nr:spore coat protein CotJB [Vallitalea guaymasensis]QUH27786.1 spore coat protein CotJB [Vallitalea guaymasensis]GMQ61146.1 spore coat protein CotJB [Vallitalea sp. AN17-2]